MKAFVLLCLCFLLTVVTSYPSGLFKLMKNERQNLKGTPFVDCGSKGTVKSVQLNDCSVAPCVVQRLKNSSLMIEFVNNVEVTTLTDKVTAILGIVPVPFPLPDPDACKDKGLTCPIAAGTDDKFHANLFIPSEAPAGVTLKVKWEMKDQSGIDEVCIEVGIKVEN